jgi:crotonobetainyl-CoA:carnitine CoA-transferase CaiB-like acyl-CoA transferase
MYPRWVVEPEPGGLSIVSAPLAGVKVVEIASFVAVPAAGALLADLGAEVIKVEVPWGEIYRHATPRLAGFDNDFAAGPPFQMDNRGKRSLGLDLALPQAQEALRKVISTADIVITNVLPARLDKYGLDPEALRADRPDLIVGRLSGYGPDGDRANDPAFDYSAFWALSGLMDHLHDLDSPPGWMRPGMGDHSAGMSLVVGLLAALRTRDAGGEGQIVDVTLQQIGYYINGNDTALALVTGETPPRHDRRAPRNPLWNHYRCQDDRWLFLVMIDSDRYWPVLARVLGRPELAEDSRFLNARERFRNSRELVAILDEVFASRPLEKWIEPMNAERIIWAPVRTLAEAIEDENAQQYGSFPTVEHPEHGTFKTVAPPLQMSGHSMTGSNPAPELAAHTAEILAEAGVDEETIALLVAVVG